MPSCAGIGVQRTSLIFNDVCFEIYHCDCQKLSFIVLVCNYTDGKSSNISRENQIKLFLSVDFYLSDYSLIECAYFEYIPDLVLVKTGNC